MVVFSVHVTRLVAALLGAALLGAGAGRAYAACPVDRVDAGGYRIFAQSAGQGAITVVFVNGNGNDSSAWAGVEPAIRKMGVQTLVYDRAGLGQSDLNPAPYRIDDEAQALKAVIAACQIRGPIILAAHSYGGLISALVAEGNAQIRGMVYIDAALPGDLSDHVVADILAEFTPQFAEVEKQAPDLAKAVIPVVKGFPQTAERMDGVQIADDLPFIDIVAEKPWLSVPQDAAHVRKVHAGFVAASGARETVLAKGSGHNVMKDRPDLVIGAIGNMLTRVKSVE